MLARTALGVVGQGVEGVSEHPRPRTGSSPVRGATAIWLSQGRTVLAGTQLGIPGTHMVIRRSHLLSRRALR